MDSVRRRITASRTAPRPDRYLVACGGSRAWILAAVFAVTTFASERAQRTDSATAAAGSAPASGAAANALAPCDRSGVRRGKDYQVGNGPKQIPSLDKVPWERLGPGDTVRIIYRPEPYPGKFAINARGTAEAPVRICGVKGPNGERPIIEGNHATTRDSMNYGRESARAVNEARSIIWIGATDAGAGVESPSYITIAGLVIRDANPTYAFVDSAGHVQRYADFAACIWSDVSHNLSVVDNDFENCAQAVFTKSIDNDDCAPGGVGTCSTISTNTLISSNIINGYGIARDDHEHGVYIQSAGAIFEYNWFKQPWPGAGGNAIKDRSVGTVIRYNRIESGAYAIDLVEAEDYANYAKSDPAYRTTFVYGNQIVKSGPLVIHYGGNNNVPDFRNGTLYFYNNTVDLKREPDPDAKLDSKPEGAAYVFRVSTTKETLQVWNNIFLYDKGIEYKALRAPQDMESPNKTGGIVSLGVNWIDQHAVDSDPYHPVQGELNGLPRLIRGLSSPVDADLVPIARSPVIGAGEAGPEAARSHPVLWQLDKSFKPVARSASGAGADLGAVQH